MKHERWKDLCTILFQMCHIFKHLKIRIKKKIKSQFLLVLLNETCFYIYILVYTSNKLPHLSSIKNKENRSYTFPVVVTKCKTKNKIKIQIKSQDTLVKILFSFLVISQNFFHLLRFSLKRVTTARQKKTWQIAKKAQRRKKKSYEENISSKRNSKAKLD